MKIRTAIGAGAFVTGLGIFVLAGSASAHHPTYSEDCAGFHASGTDYPAGSHVTIKIDGQTKLDKTFDGEGFKYDTTWDQTKDHPFSLVVTSPDHIGEVNWSGTQIHCVTPPTTTVPTTVPPTTVPPTTVPVVTTVPAPTTAPVVTTVPPVDTTVAPPATVKDTPSIAQTPPTTACTPAGQPIGPGAHLCTQLPATGSGDAVPLVAIGGGIFAAGVILVAARRLPRAA